MIINDEKKKGLQTTISSVQFQFEIRAIQTRLTVRAEIRTKARKGKDRAGQESKFNESKITPMHDAMYDAM